jgi:hypothetical protein
MKEEKRRSSHKLWLASMALVLPLLCQSAQAQGDLKSGLKAYWNFDAQNFKDSVGYYDGTANGTEPIAFVDGKPGFGKCIKLNGDDQFIEITGPTAGYDPDELAFQGGSISIAAWFTVDAFDTSWQALIAKGEGTNWRVHRNSGNPTMSYAGGVGEGPNDAPDVTDGAWHHLVAISDANAVNFGTCIYVDGAQYAVVPDAPVLNANGRNVMIGENPDARGREWEGNIDDVAIWDRVLTEAEIAQLYNKGTGTPLSVLLGAVVGDSDKDGMPDDWELQYGFNPNDPTDATKDADGDGVSNLDEYKAGTNPTDTTKPTVVSVASGPSFDLVKITFSEDLDPATATVTANYTITPSLAVTAATYSKKVVTLTTAKQAPDGTAYTVEVKGVKDTSKNEVPAGTKVTFYTYITGPGNVLGKGYLNNGGGTTVGDLEADPNFPDNPTVVYSYPYFEWNASGDINIAANNGYGDNYGAQLSGVFTAPATGEYQFWVCSDDQSMLYLSTDEKPANKQPIAAEQGWSDPRLWTTASSGDATLKDSAQYFGPITLQKGKGYYIEAVFKEGGGGDNLAVAVKAPDGSINPNLPIPGKYVTALGPAEGSFISRIPAPNAKNVKPSPKVSIVHYDGKTPWTDANVSLKFDGAPVTPTITKDGVELKIDYTPSAMLASGSTHVITLGHPDPSGQPATTEWSFTTVTYSGVTKDKVKSYTAWLLGNSTFTADGKGVSNKAGDYGLDLTTKGGPVQVADADFLTALNAATAKDELSVSMWIKKYDIADSSAVWFSSPSQARVFQAHTPWSNNEVYFDTAGCCDGGTQRINASIETFPGYTGDISWWTNNWHLFVFTKKADQKNIYIDGTLFLNGSNTGTLSTDIDQLNIGADNSTTGGKMHAIVDDVAVYGKELSAANITALKGGTLPSALPAAVGLIAYWDFNDGGVKPPPTISIAAAGANMTLTFTGTLQSATSITGPWTDVVGATSPATLPATGAQAFYRAKQ